MVKHESFKQRIRARMADTGERYAAARLALIDQAATVHRRVWISDPDLSEEAVLENTGRGWDDWCDLIDAWPDRTNGHTAIATYVREEMKVDPWWAQGVTVGYERITGIRLPHQRPDGSFTADKSKTISFDGVVLREMLLDAGGRDDLFGGEPTELRFKPASKSIRLGIGPGIALFALELKDGGRTKVTVSHEKLPEFENVAEWKFFWTEWLDALDEASPKS